MRDEAETKIVDAFYRGVSDDKMLDLAVGMLAAHFDSPSACLGEIDAVDGRWMIGSGTLDSSQLKRYARAAAVDPAPRAFSALRLCTASTTDRLWTDRERGRSVFFNEYLRPAGLDHSMASPLFLDSRRFSLIGIHQETHRKRFDDDDIACLERLSPHVARTLQLRRTFLDMRRKEKTFAAIVEGRSTGMVGRAGRSTLFINRAAQVIAATSDGLTFDRHGRIVVNDERASRRVAALEADVLAGGAGGVVRVPRPSRRQAFVVMIARLPGDCDPSTEEIGILYSIHDPSRGGRPTHVAVAGVLGIPRGPAKVVAALLEGHDVASYSDAAGITVNTVRCQLKTAFALTGTRSQMELVRTALAAIASLEVPLAH